MDVTLCPHAFRMTPILLAVTPFPSPLTTPPETRTYFMASNLTRTHLCFLAQSKACYALPSQFAKRPTPFESIVYGFCRMEYGSVLGSHHVLRASLRSSRLVTRSLCQHLTVDGEARQGTVKRAMGVIKCRLSGLIMSKTSGHLSQHCSPEDSGI